MELAVAARWQADRQIRNHLGLETQCRSRGRGCLARYVDCAGQGLSRSKLAGAACMRTLHSGDLGLLVGCIDHGPDAGSICALTSGYSGERLDVMSQMTNTGRPVDPLTAMAKARRSTSKKRRCRRRAALDLMFRPLSSPEGASSDIGARNGRFASVPWRHLGQLGVGQSLEIDSCALG